MLEVGWEVVCLEKAKNDDWNLVGQRYKNVIINGFFKLTSLKDICKIESGNSAPQNQNLFLNGQYPFFRVSDLAKVHISNNLIDTKDKLNEEGVRGLKLFKKGSILLPKSGASTLLKHLAIMGCDGYASSHLAIIQPFKNKVKTEYIFYALQNLNVNLIALNKGYPSIKIEDLYNVQIPLPPLEEQQKIVEELDIYQKIIDGAKQIVDSWKPYLKINKDCENENNTLQEKLFADLIKSGFIVGKKGNFITKATAVKGNIPVIAGGKSSPYSHNKINYNGNVITISGFGAYSGFVWYHKEPIWASDCSVIYSTNEEKLITKYLFLYIERSTRNYLSKTTWLWAASRIFK